MPYITDESERARHRSLTSVLVGTVEPVSHVPGRMLTANRLHSAAARASSGPVDDVRQRIWLSG